jgi:hypothetical protein
MPAMVTAFNTEPGRSLLCAIAGIVKIKAASVKIDLIAGDYKAYCDDGFSRG